MTITMNLTSKSIVDTNVWLFSLDKQSSKNAQAREFILANVDKIIIAHQNVLEAIRVMTHPKFASRVSVKTAVSSIVDATEEIPHIFPLPTTHRLTLNFMKKYDLRGDQIFDAYLASTALDHGIDTIVTDNEKDFAKFEEINVLNPFR